MPIIDDRGRVFGRLNLVDAAIGVLLLALLPAAYGSYRLFRDPVPKLRSVMPSVVRQGPNLQVEVRGENLRPYMRVSFNDVQGGTFLFYNPKSAFVQVPDLPSGKYDVVLYDYMQEVSRLPAAFTFEAPPPPPTIMVDVTGFLTSLAGELDKRLLPGIRLSAGAATAEILSVGPTEPAMLRIKTGATSTLTVPADSSQELPLRLRMPCLVETTAAGAMHCTVGGVPLAADANVRLFGFGTLLNLRVSAVNYPGRSRMAIVHVRFVVSPDVLGRVKKGDQDVGARVHPAGAMATLVSMAEKVDTNASMVRDDRVRQAVPTGRLVTIEGVLSVPVEETPLGWVYKDAPVKVGAPFSFETTAYTMDGGVTDVTMADADRPSGSTAPATPPRR